MCAPGVLITLGNAAKGTYFSLWCSARASSKAMRRKRGTAASEHPPYPLSTPSPRPLQPEGTKLSCDCSSLFQHSLGGSARIGWGDGSTPQPPPKTVGFSKQVSPKDRWVERSPCPERSAESCLTSFPAVISRMYLPLSESLGSRIWSQISSKVVPALTRSPLSRRFSLNVRAKKWLTGLCPGQAGCLPSCRHPCPRLLSWVLFPDVWADHP